MSTVERLKKKCAARKKELDDEDYEGRSQENIGFNRFLETPEIKERLKGYEKCRVPLQDAINTLYEEFQLNNFMDRVGEHANVRMNTEEQGIIATMTGKQVLLEDAKKQLLEINKKAPTCDNGKFLQEGDLSKKGWKKFRKKMKEAEERVKKSNIMPAYPAPATMEEILNKMDCSFYDTLGQSEYDEQLKEDQPKVSEGGRKKKTRRRRKRSGGTRKAEKKALPTISSNFESGNIKLIDISTKKNKYNVVLEIEHEPYPSRVKKKYENWFYFKALNVQRKNINYTIQNIRIFDNDWRGFNVCYSYDNKNWKRIDTSFSKVNKNLKWKHKCTKKNIYFAYYPPYTTEMKKTLINKYKNRNGVKSVTLRTSNNVDALILGNGPLNIYIVARQHPGESIGSWMIEGFLKEYFSNVQRKVIQKIFTIYVIPMANPNGVKLGHWYTNKKGQNLNRSWRHNKTPETTAIKRLITNNKGILYLDLHGDEGASKHFITTCMKKQNTVHESFNKLMGKLCPNFQLEDYYKRKGHKVFGTMDCFDKQKTLTIEGAMKHPLYNHKTLQDEGIEIGKAIYKTITHKISCVDN